MPAAAIFLVILSRPLAPLQRAPSHRAASPACGSLFFLPCALLVCVRLAKSVPKNRCLPFFLLLQAL